MTWPPPELVRRGLEIPVPEAALPGLEQGQKIVVRRLAELRAMPDAEVEWLAERFLALGAITDLVAYIKTGKTTLCCQLIASVLHGDSFLGLKVSQAPVVLLSEERPATLLMAMDEARIEDSDNLHVLLWNEQRGIPWPEIVKEARAYCEQVGAKLLVVDTLGMWADVDDEKEAGEAKQAMIPLLESAVGVAVVVLRQARKSGGEIHNAGRGSGAYGGAADILLHLDYTRNEQGKVLEESSKRMLTIKSRLERETVAPMELDYAQGRYFSTTPMVVSSSAKQAIRNHLEKYGPDRPSEIAHRTGLARNTVIKTLGRMEDVVSDGGVYGLAEFVVTPPVTTSASNGDNPGDNGDTIRPMGGAVTDPPPPLGGVGAAVTDRPSLLGRLSVSPGCRQVASDAGLSCSKHKRLLDPGGKCPVSGELATEIAETGDKR